MPASTEKKEKETVFLEKLAPFPFSRDMVKLFCKQIICIHIFLYIFIYYSLLIINITPLLCILYKYLINTIYI